MFCLAVRSPNNLTSRIQAHTEEVCSLKWSSRGNVLASGGNENRIYIWESSKMSSSNFLHRFDDHSAAVKTLAWCPYQSDVLASGGGTKDGCIKIWNTQKGTCISSKDTKAQAGSIIFLFEFQCKRYRFDLRSVASASVSETLIL